MVQESTVKTLIEESAKLLQATMAVRLSVANGDKASDIYRVCMSVAEQLGDVRHLYRKLKTLIEEFDRRGTGDCSDYETAETLRRLTPLVSDLMQACVRATCMYADIWCVEDFWKLSNAIYDVKHLVYVSWDPLAVAHWHEKDYHKYIKSADESLSIDGILTTLCESAEVMFDGPVFVPTKEPGHYIDAKHAFASIAKIWDYAKTLE